MQAYDPSEHGTVAVPSAGTLRQYPPPIQSISPPPTPKGIGRDRTGGAKPETSRISWFKVVGCGLRSSELLFQPSMVQGKPVFILTMFIFNVYFMFITKYHIPLTSMTECDVRPTFVPTSAWQVRIFDRRKLGSTAADTSTSVGDASTAAGSRRTANSQRGGQGRPSSAAAAGQGRPSTPTAAGTPGFFLRRFLPQPSLILFSHIFCARL